MTTPVTVLGASGSTVTIPFTSAVNAAAAQSALYKISQLVLSTSLEQYQYPGSGSVPAPSLLGGVVISGSSPVNTGPLPAYEFSVVSNSTAIVSTVVGGATPVAVTLPGTTVTGAFNPMTVASGTSGIMFLNVSTNAKIFLGGGSNFIYERDANAKAEINADSGSTYVEAKQGATTINAFAGAGVVVQEGGSGSVVMNASEGSSSFLVMGGDATGMATLNGSAGTSFTYYGIDGAKTLINPGAADVTVVGNLNGDTSGTTTLFGGTGTAHVYGGTGYFKGGTGGANELGSSTVAGGTTLVGAHDGDVLYNAGKGNMLIAGAGAETLVGIQDSTAAGGSKFQLGVGGQTTVFGDAAGGNSFYLNAGLGLIDGDGSATTHSAANFYSVLTGGGTDVVFGFISGLDQFSRTYSTGTPTVSSLTYYDANSSTIFGAHAGTELILSDSTKVDFYDVQVKTTDIT